MTNKQIETEAKNALALVARSIDAHPGAGQVARLVKFLAGIYNSSDYPFELAELRGLDARLADACLTYLAYDVLGIQEVHRILPGGAERLNKWFVEYGLRPADRSVDELKSSEDEREVHVNAKLVTYSSAPGYRDAWFTFDLSEPQTSKSLRVTMKVSADDNLALKAHIEDVHQSAWRNTRGPLDKKGEEQRPGWLDSRFVRNEGQTINAAIGFSEGELYEVADAVNQVLKEYLESGDPSHHEAIYGSASNLLSATRKIAGVMFPGSSPDWLTDFDQRVAQLRSQKMQSEAARQAVARAGSKDEGSAKRDGIRTFQTNPDSL